MQYPRIALNRRHQLVRRQYEKFLILWYYRDG
ncbi:hypothetical protein Cagg_1400 [Chloroflexus aggregans DSM 9485]|uniref:Uncharacterized protein n=1 Tax=Chloroflexus aggregans (strain MD-66 / DSM 9485) TaxID=326427 RepID=B8G8P5_CHLAD|nr:hypothetical protein Cagg_1400 [Chloroflexus aggregans DSM 9485]